MHSKVKAFLQQAGVEISSELIERIITFLVSPNHSITFNRGQLYFMSGGVVSESMACSGNNDAIVEFDGQNITQINSIYYLGENIERDRSSIEIEFESEGGSSNNNNNNNNNGNNG
jgi:hypothetical protein